MIRFVLSAVFLFAFFCGNSQTCTNNDFESSSPGTYTSGSGVGGWSVTSQFSTSCTNTLWSSGSPEFMLVNTPVFSVPGLGVLPNSPLGGTVIAALNTGTANASATRLVKTVTVGTSNLYFNAYYAFTAENYDHNDCCNDAGYEVIVRTPSGSIDACQSRTISPFGCGLNTYSVSGGYAFSNWQPLTLDLSLYTGSVVTVEIIARDCGYGGHFARMYFDAQCSGSPLICSCIFIPPAGVHFCAGSNVALLTAPPSTQSYSWTGPTPISPSQASLSALQIYNPVAGSTYTLSMLNAQGCLAKSIYTLVFTSVAIASVSASPACGPSGQGSATIQATGSGSGYNISWYNSSASVVATSSQVNLPSGNYTVTVHAAGSAGCGSASAVANITAYSFTANVLTPTLGACSGDSLLMPVFVSGSSSAYQYSWTPGPFISYLSSQAALYTPTVTPGATASQVFSVTITPTAVPQCAVTRTILATAGNPPTPTLGTSGASCHNAAPFQVTASPTTGVFTGAFIGSAGVITPTTHPAPGTFTYSYYIAEGGCSRSVNGAYTILAAPQLSVSGNVQVCQGDTIGIRCGHIFVERCFSRPDLSDCRG